MKQSKGFSLIELLIVVVIIGIIAAIAIPALQQKRREVNEYNATVAMMQVAQTCKVVPSKCFLPDKQPRGYILDLKINGMGAFFITAVPATGDSIGWDRSGDHRFYTDDTLLGNKEINVLKAVLTSPPPTKRNQQGVEVVTATIGDPVK